MQTAQGLTKLCESVLTQKAAGAKSCTIAGVALVTEDGESLLRPDPKNSGWCQRTSRLMYLAATGEAMPEADCCAGHTCVNLLASSVDRYKGPWDPAKLLPGDYLYFSGGGACGTCGRPVGHVGIWLSGGRMFQHTSRDHLAITGQGPTLDQQGRFVAAFRLLPQAAASAPAPVKPAPERVWQFTAKRDPNGDIVAEGWATHFDDKETRTGIDASRTDVVCCSLPRGLCDATKGSPFTGVPDFSLVRFWFEGDPAVTGDEEGELAVLGDEGPAWKATAGTGVPGSAMVDINPGLAKALKVPLGENVRVKIRVLAGSEKRGRDVAKSWR